MPKLAIVIICSIMLIFTGLILYEGVVLVKAVHKKVEQYGGEVCGNKNYQQRIIQ